MPTAQSDEETDVIAKTVEIGAGEPVILPNEFQRALGLAEGGTFTVLQLDGLVLVAPKRLASLDALEKIRRVLVEGSLTLDDLLSGLASVREQIYQERYTRSTKLA